MISEIQFVLFVIVFILSDFLTKIVCTRIWPVLILLLYDWIKLSSVTFQGLFKFHQATTVALNLTYQHWNLHVMWGSEALLQSDHWHSDNALYGCMFWRLCCCGQEGGRDKRGKQFTGCLLCRLEHTSISLYWTSAEPLTLSGSLVTTFLNWRQEQKRKICHHMTHALKEYFPQQQWGTWPFLSVCDWFQATSNGNSIGVKNSLYRH